jgi:adenylate kinase
MKKYHLIIFGPPGVGKGTQANLISEKLELFHFSTGDALRKAFDEKTELGIKANEIMNRGELVPDDIMIGIVKDALISNSKSNGFILDGFPRTVKQAESLEKIFEQLGINNILILYLIADNEELLRRLINRGRIDDNVSIIENRLKIYIETTAPVLGYYNKKHKIIEINGIGTIEDINFSISSELERIFSIN